MGAPELIIVLLIILLIFGGTKLPKLARSMGQASKEFKKGLNDGAADDEDEAPLPPLREGHPVEGARWTLFDQSFEAAGQVGFTLAAQGVEAE